MITMCIAGPSVFILEPWAVKCISAIRCWSRSPAKMQLHLRFPEDFSPKIRSYPEYGIHGIGLRKKRISDDSAQPIATESEKCLMIIHPDHIGHRNVLGAAADNEIHRSILLDQLFWGRSLINDPVGCDLLRVNGILYYDMKFALHQDPFRLQHTSAYNVWHLDILGSAQNNRKYDLTEDKGGNNYDAHADSGAIADFDPVLFCHHRPRYFDLTSLAAKAPSILCLKGLVRINPDSVYCDGIQPAASDRANLLFCFRNLWIWCSFSAGFIVQVE